jgi:AcrR family transcriptional regulator
MDCGRASIARRLAPASRKLDTVPTTSKGAQDNTRHRLMQTAGELFAERGFRQATVREICQRAGANLAAVKYHFGNKEGLYRAVLLETHRELRDQEPLPSLADAANPEDALRALVGFALRFLLLRRSRHSFAGQMITRELQDPTEALTELVQRVMMPMRQELERIVAALLDDADHPKLRGQLANFVLGLCAFHEFGRPVLERFGYPPPRHPNQRAALEHLADAITAFALGGIARAREDALDTSR